MQRHTYVHCARIRKVETISHRRTHCIYSEINLRLHGVHAHRIQLRGGYLRPAHETTSNKLRTRFLRCRPAVAVFFSSFCMFALFFWPRFVHFPFRMPRDSDAALPLTLFLFRLIDRQQATNGCFIHFERPNLHIECVSFVSFAFARIPHAVGPSMRCLFKSNSSRSDATIQMMPGRMNALHIVSHAII